MKVPLLTKKKWPKHIGNSDSTELSDEHHWRCQICVKQVRKTSSVLQIYPSSFLTRWSISTVKSLKRAFAFQVAGDSTVCQIFD